MGTVVMMVIAILTDSGLIARTLLPVRPNLAIALLILAPEALCMISIITNCSVFSSSFVVKNRVSRYEFH